jgi:hypothetical protein
VRYPDAMPEIGASLLASAGITLLRWWTLLAPLGMLLALVTQARGRVRAALMVTIVTILPPLLVLLPLTVMRAGPQSLTAVAAVVADVTALVLAVIPLARGCGPSDIPGRLSQAAPAVGLAASMLGAVALLVAISL